MNLKNEWHQPRIIRTTVVQGGAEMVGARVPPYQRAGTQDMPQNVVNVQSAVMSSGTQDISENTRSQTRARASRASQASADRTRG